MAWPETLPAIPKRDGFGFIGPDNVLEWPTDIGPGITRRRSTKGSRTLRAVFVWTRDQFKDVFLPWIAEGGDALPFEFEVPLTGETLTCRLVGGQPAYDVTPGPGELLEVALVMKVL